MKTLLKIDGYEYTKLPITSYKPPLTVVDGEGTGRTLATGLPMFREPAGTFYNLRIIIGGAVIDGAEEEFQRLVRTIESFGVVQFKPIEFTLPSGEIYSTEAYCTNAEFELVRSSPRGELFWAPLPLYFVTKEAYLTP